METLRSPGSFHEFSEGLPEQVSHERALRVYSICLDSYRRQLVRRLGTTAELLHYYGPEPQSSSDKSSSIKPEQPTKQQI